MDSDDAEKFLAKLDSPIPGVSRLDKRDDFDDISQLNNL